MHTDRYIRGVSRQAGKRCHAAAQLRKVENGGDVLSGFTTAWRTRPSTIQIPPISGSFAVRRQQAVPHPLRDALWEFISELYEHAVDEIVSVPFPTPGTDGLANRSAARSL